MDLCLIIFMLTIYLCIVSYMFITFAYPPVCWPLMYNHLFVDCLCITTSMWTCAWPTCAWPPATLTTDQKQQLNSQKQSKMRWKAKPLIYFWLSYVVFCPVLEECWNEWIKLYICFRVCCIFLKVVRSKRTVGVASVHGSVSSKDTSPIKRWSRVFVVVVIVVSVGDFSNKLVFSSSKTQL